MRALRFVRPAEDGSHLVVETTDGIDQFYLCVDAALRSAAQLDPPGQPSPQAEAPAVPAARTAEPTIAPREIQMRVRAGEAPQDLADSYGVSLDRLMRFAGPVLDERKRIADEARRARARRSTTEGQIVIFGEAVDSRFTAHGIPPSDVGWDSRRREDGEWQIVAEWLGGDSTHTAEWVFHRSSRTVTPVDDAAADLLSDRPIRPVAPPEPTPERPALAAAPPLAPGIVAFPPMPDAHTAPVPPLDDVFDQEAPPEGPREVPTLVPASAAEAELEFDVPPLPLAVTDPSTRPAAAVPGLAKLRNLGMTKREESDEERAARARVPSWDDILLGVRRKE